MHSKIFYITYRVSIYTELSATSAIWYDHFFSLTTTNKCLNIWAICQDLRDGTFWEETDQTIIVTVQSNPKFYNNVAIAFHWYEPIIMIHTSYIICHQKKLGPPTAVMVKYKIFWEFLRIRIFINLNDTHCHHTPLNIFYQTKFKKTKMNWNMFDLQMT